MKNITINFRELLKNIQKRISLTQSEEEAFCSLLTHKKIQKKEFLLQEAEVCTFSAFVIKGCLKSYSIDKNGFEHILQFAPVDWWITDMVSLISEEPGHLYIDAVEDSEVLILTKENQNSLYGEIPKFERYFRIILENSLVANRQRVMDNLELTAKERYAKFCKTYPTLINTLPQKLIAAYIGVKPEFFSKMKSEYLREI